jgi:hypothetical protein
MTIEIQIPDWETMDNQDQTFYMKAVQSLIGWDYSGEKAKRRSYSMSTETGLVEIYDYEEGFTAPTLEEINTQKATEESNWTLYEYARKRAKAYRRLNQMEMQYDDMVNGTTTWQDAIDAIKAQYPKPAELQ